MGDTIDGGEQVEAARELAAEAVEVGDAPGAGSDLREPLRACGTEPEGGYLGGARLTDAEVGRFPGTDQPRPAGGMIHALRRGLKLFGEDDGSHVVGEDDEPFARTIELFHERTPSKLFY
ncbi:hypothetical protein ACFVJW_36120 [Streptomyces libani]|uniref:hypothetical protein n=1 Tax=Streptomyces nigrescens TaxID=1920 RepID=UPI003634DCB3